MLLNLITIRNITHLKVEPLEVVPRLVRLRLQDQLIVRLVRLQGGKRRPPRYCTQHTIASSTRETPFRRCRPHYRTIKHTAYLDRRTQVARLEARLEQEMVAACVQLAQSEFIAFMIFFYADLGTPV